MKTNIFQKNQVEIKSVPGKILLRIILLFLSSLTSFAQSPPDIVWTTNAAGILSVAFSADSTKLASGSGDGIASIWVIPSGSLLRQVYVPDGNWVQALAFSHDGNYLATGGGGITAMWRIIDGYRIWAGGPDASSYSLDFSPDNTLVGISRSDGINVRNALTGGGRGGPHCLDHQTQKLS